MKAFSPELLKFRDVQKVPGFTGKGKTSLKHYFIFYIFDLVVLGLP